jgi:hypothetical protein
LGIVTITVQLGKEKDLKGYRLFKANGTDHEFSVIQEGFRKDKFDSLAVKLVFVDTVTLKSLTPKIYYRVKALDFNYNQSEFSEIMAVTRPDTIPPTAPVISDVLVSEKQIELHFVPSGSIDVKEHIVYRKTDNDTNWKVLLKWHENQTAVVDTAVTIGTTYYYSMRAMDSSNLFSEYAHAVYGKPYDNGVRPPVKNLVANVENKKVALRWEYPQSVKGVFFVIYKKDNKGSLIQYGRTSEKLFIDQNTEKENVYAIKALTQDGGQSQQSNLVTKSIE